MYNGCGIYHKQISTPWTRPNNLANKLNKESFISLADFEYWPHGINLAMQMVFVRSSQAIVHYTDTLV